MKLGFSNATFSKWNENTIPRQTTLQKIADYFNVSVDYLLGKEAPSVESPASDSETELLELFRMVPEESREMVISMIRVALQQKK
ncbi:MAG: helix-turn-helix transcriptional regulator [Clostridia bacterium]|nr:helix-turn-helix transcriptional regulator [Clostridia bacterium]